MLDLQAWQNEQERLRRTGNLFDRSNVGINRLNHGCRVSQKNSKYDMWKKKPAYPGLIKNGREKVQNGESYCTYICNVIEASWISKRLFE